jgi:hypothetical protein
LSFVFSTASRPWTQSPTHLVLGVLSQEVKRLERESDHSYLMRDEVCVDLYIYFPIRFHDGALNYLCTGTNSSVRYFKLLSLLTRILGTNLRIVISTPSILTEVFRHFLQHLEKKPEMLLQIKLPPPPS